jgi:ElaB/YqjD/DUF883 family membrane-anchored ribosome-binding protein
MPTELSAIVAQQSHKGHEMNADQTNPNNSHEPESDATRAAEDVASETASQINQGAEQLQEALADIQARLSECTRECIETTDNYVHENPWTSVGIAAGVGLIFGMLLGRR